MRNDLIELLALLVSVGYIKSFRVTKNYISRKPAEISGYYTRNMR